MNGPRPITVTIAALGGQGGGVVSDWIIDVARRSGYLAQATSVPGVAQRTGATIYYLELFPLAALPPDLPISVEAPCEAHAALPVEKRACHALEATQPFLWEYSDRRRHPGR